MSGHRIAALEERVAALERLLFTHEHQSVGTSLFPGRRRPHWVEPDGTSVTIEPAAEKTTEP